MIHISYKRSQYQEDMIKNIKITDNVVEIGCHVGVSTRIISRLCQDGTVYAFDNSPESIEAMNNLKIQYSNIEYINADVREKYVLNNFLEKGEKVDVLCVDLGGGYHPDTVFKVFFIWSSILQPRVSLIRNKGLIDFISSTNTTENIKSDKGYLESSADNIRPENLEELKIWSKKL